MHLMNECNRERRRWQACLALRHSCNDSHALPCLKPSTHAPSSDQLAGSSTSWRTRTSAHLHWCHVDVKRPVWMDTRELGAVPAGRPPLVHVEAVPRNIPWYALHLQGQARSGPVGVLQ